jgi:steroid 5-alpha reductase family enzyme
MTLDALAILAAMALTGLVAAMTAAWAIQRRTQNSGWIDVSWTLGVGAVGVALALQPFSGGALWRGRAVAALVAVWSLRLGLHIAGRARRAGDDPRYGKLIEDWGSAAPIRLYGFLMAQAVVGAVLAVAVALAAQSPGASVRPQDIVGLPLVALAIAGEALADAELGRFKKNPADRNAICDVGLWRLSRHPNYVCEFLVWAAIAVLAFEPFSPLTWCAALAPAIMYWTLRYASGVPPLEEHMKRTRPEAFAAYAARTPEFFPTFLDKLVNSDLYYPRSLRMNSMLKTLLRSQAVTIFMVSLLFLLLALFIDTKYVPPGETPQYIRIIVEVLKTFGVAGLALVIFSYWLETGAWRDYFEDTLQRIVMDQSYLAKLDDSQLKNTLINLMKARFKGKIIDQKRSFFEHFENNVANYIGSPFRERINATIYYRDCVDETSKWMVNDNLEFVCRHIGESIQEKISWAADEAEQVESVRIDVCPQLENGLYGDKEVLLPLTTEPEGINKLSKGISLANYAKCDRLKIFIEARYRQDKHRYSAWAMADPSLDIDVTIHFPEDFEIITDTFVTSEANASITSGPTYKRIVYDGWVLPEHGIVWQLRTKTKKTEIVKDSRKGAS